MREVFWNLLMAYWTFIFRAIDLDVPNSVAMPTLWKCLLDPLMLDENRERGIVWDDDGIFL